MAKRVAQEIVAYCTSCRMDLVHVIEAMDGERIARVHCKTCKKQHAYRPAKGQKEPAAKQPVKRSAPKRKQSNAIPLEWEKVMEANKEMVSRPYSMKGSFSEGEKIDHPKFGTGWVTRLIGTNKMEVLFKEDLKIMVRGDSRMQLEAEQ